MIKIMGTKMNLLIWLLVSLLIVCMGASSAKSAVESFYPVDGLDTSDGSFLLDNVIADDEIREDYLFDSRNNLSYDETVYQEYLFAVSGLSPKDFFEQVENGIRCPCL